MNRSTRTLVVVCAVVVAYVVLARSFGAPHPAHWWRIDDAIVSSGRRIRDRHVSTETLWQWCGWLLWACWIWVVVTFAWGMLRRTQVGWAPGSRLAAFVLTAAVPVATIASAERPMVSVEATESCSVVPSRTGISGLDVFGLGSSLVGAGLFWRVRSRRESHLRAGGSPDVPLCQESVDGSAAILVARLDLGVRHLSSHGRHPTYLVVEPEGDVIAEFGSPVKPTPSWVAHGLRSLRLPATVALSELGGTSDSRPPVLLHIGTTAAGQVWVDLDAIREFVIDERGGSGVWSAVVNGITLSPFANHLGVVSNTDHQAIFGRRVMRVDSGDDTIDVARRVKEALAIVDGPTTVEYGADDLVIRRGIPDGASIGLSFDEHEWRLVPAGVQIRPVGFEGDEIDRIRRLLGEPAPPIVVEPQPIVVESSSTWSFVASVLGTPEVVHVSGRRVDFEKTKAEELVIWLSLHPEQRRRSLARTALWNAPIKDATFSNVTADARRSMSLIEVSDEPWVGITMTDDLPLHPRVVSDVQILRENFESARRYPEEGGLSALRDGLEFVRGTPFATSSYLWPDNVGVATDAAVLVVRSALLMAEMCQQIGDIDGVYWATAKGLLALPGHEELVGIRMRTHADHGDMAAVRAEWDSYCRLIAQDEWTAADPSPKLVELWRRLNGLSTAR